MPVDPADPDTTLVSGRYRLHEILGSGGMGTVWRATDEFLGREVALKQLRHTDLDPADAELARARTMREARIAASLHHPHIVSIFDALVVDGEIWLVLEYVPSVSLGGLLRERGSLPPDEAAEIGAQTAAALTCAHAAGIVHRDVKPDNLLVTPTTSKLTDFGIAHAATAPSLTATGLLTGTIAYLAPETARGEGSDSRSDMYALGATLFATVEGAPPFGNSGDMLALITRIGRGGAPEPRNAGPLTTLISHLLADDPDARPTATEARQALSLLAAPTPQPSTQPSTAQPPISGDPTPGTRSAEPPPTGWRRRLLIIGAVVLTIAAFGSVATAVALRTGVAGRTGTPTPISITDPATADPCSLIDIAPLSRYGTVVLSPEYADFDSCRARIDPPGGGELAVFVGFRGLLPPGSSLEGTPAQVGALTLTRLPVDGNSCYRNVLLPDLNWVTISAVRIDPSTADLCDIAETAAIDATTLLTERGIGTRTPPDAGTALAGVDACSLLTPAELAALPGIGPTGTPGFGGWSCHWADAGVNKVDVNYYRGLPPTDELDAIAVDIAGREGALGSANGYCVVKFVQRSLTDHIGSRIADRVEVYVTGSAPEADLCASATKLATAAAAKLPAPS